MTSSSSSSSSPTEDPNIPFFLHYSDNANTINVSWSRYFLLSISINNKLGFLDGTIPTPDLSNPPYVSWLQCNNILLTWILNFVFKDIASKMFFMTLAKQVALDGSCVVHIAASVHETPAPSASQLTLS
ncbi:hypothetical protein F2P56_034884 [Juglans regia]|uniref:Retrotransposon Copia-like N-terminal domain-containing protein n=1 Tax=Juglans regia TaxID=51240 RepID=A0A833TI38_JUGRE|nr:hypothetical protein F2P56_034884 [Juglans regia]